MFCLQETYLPHSIEENQRNFKHGDTQRRSSKMNSCHFIYIFLHLLVTLTLCFYLYLFHQHERSEALTQLSKLKETLDKQKHQEVVKFEETIAEQASIIANQRSKIETLSAEVTQLQHQDQHRVALQAAAVQQAVQEVKDDMNKQRETLQAGWAAEQKRTQAEFVAQLEDGRRQNEVGALFQNEIRS